jgi:nucleotide-binding universal stress UspA family protein
MYSKILIPLDESLVAEQVLPHARLFAEKLKIPIELLEVVDPETLMGAESKRDAGRENLLAERKKTASYYLENIAGALRGSSGVQTAVAVGHPAEVIVDRAGAAAETLIAMTTHGRSGVQRWLLGSVADKVLQATRNYLLLVRATDEKAQAVSFKSILVPLDGSELAESAIAPAQELANKMNLEIVLVRVFNLPVADDEGYWDQRTWELIRDEAQEYLDRKVKELKGQGLARVTSVLLEGFAGERIITLAQETPDNLIAMCTHGRSGVRRWVLGSVTDRVVRHSGDPVLVIRAPGAGSAS